MNRMNTINIGSRLNMIIGATLLTVFLFSGSLASAENLKGSPGYMDLEWINIPDDADEVRDVDLSTVLLSIAADAEENDDEALLKALGMVKSVRVKSWSFSGEDATASKAMKKISADLEKDDWKRLVYMKDADETVSVNTRYEGEEMVGLMIVNYSVDDSVTFINVVGDLDLGTLFRLVKEFDHDSLEDMFEELDDVDGINIEVDHDDD
ncbi:MAG: hypothetical protein ACI9UK_000945 [Candidatus Krumholzibacteriia bacterium]|jgi:hypothetical protein